MEFWNESITEKSYRILYELNKKYEFTLIGGWALWLYTGVLKSKDIGIIVDYNTLLTLKREYPHIKRNDRLRKYEIKIDEVSVGMYVPHYSDLVIPPEDILEKYTTNVQGFNVPIPEVLLILKQQAGIQRNGTIKGLKDKVDILSLLELIDPSKYLQLVPSKEYLEHLKRVVIQSDQNEFRYLGITNRSAYP